ncbi:hypothetical protein DFS33DRAFT_903602 [Desarmillaria ectypa]|nr:hypothetical protein DFS33DRAFT_903602 [Desarmillaria ectypa]
MELEGCDDDRSDLGPLEMHPMWKEALQAMMTVQKYIAEMDSSFTWQMETVLPSFGRQTQLEGVQEMRNIEITDFFH